MSTVDLPQNTTAGKDTIRMINANVRPCDTKKCAVWHAIQKLIILTLKEWHAMSTCYIFCTDDLWNWEFTQCGISSRRLWITGNNIDGSDRKSILTQHLSDFRFWEWWLGHDAVEADRNFQTFAGPCCLSLLSEDEGSNLLHKYGKLLPVYTASHLRQ